MLLVKQLLNTGNTDTNIFTDESEKCEGKGGCKFPVPVTAVKIHIITEISLLSFYFMQINGDLFFIWHSNEHKTRRHIHSRNRRLCKRFEIGENDEEMSKAKGQNSFLHGANPCFKPC